MSEQNTTKVRVLVRAMADGSYVAVGVSGADTAELLSQTTEIANYHPHMFVFMADQCLCTWIECVVPAPKPLDKLTTLAADVREVADE